LTASEINSAPATSQPIRAPYTNPYFGILGVFLGAGLATLNARLVGVGLADLRGAKGFGFDEASWLPTALNMATMFSGVFVVFVNALFGPRRILLPAAAIFAIVSAMLPLVPGYWPMVALMVIAGLTAGTFYSLTLTFVLTALPKKLIIFGIAAYAADIVFVSNIATLLEGWYIDHFSWAWIFWTAAAATPLMILCIYFGIPRRPAPPGPAPSWRGFAYFSVSLALIYGALDQGERLDWLNSGVIVAMLSGGVFLLIATIFRRIAQPNPILKLSFLNRRNTIILALSIFVFKFVHLAVLVLVPGFLGTIQQYRPLQTGHAMAWVAVPMFAMVWLVAALTIHTSSRLTLAAGLTLVAVVSWICSRVDSAWAGNNFELLDLLLALGLAASYVGLVSGIVLEGLESGALTAAANAATFSGLMHFVRIFGGQIGTAMMSWITVRERFHDNVLGLNVQAGSWLTDERVHALSAGLFSPSTGPEEAQSRATDILSQQVRAQAYTMAISDGFVVIGWMVVAYLLLLLFLRPAKVSYKILRKMP
jgi:DHA2 family multidrug resistance protein